MAASRSSRCVEILVATSALLALLAGPAGAAKVLQTRVGVHDEYTRIVFELDTPAGYQIERRATESGGEELVVSLDASAKDMTLDTDESEVVASVDVTDTESGAVAHIRLATQEVRLKEMILANPPRIVLDVIALQPAPVVAAAPVEVPDLSNDDLAELPVDSWPSDPPLLADTPSPV